MSLRAVTNTEPRAHRIPAGRYTLHVYDLGNPNGYPVAVLHGGPGDRSDLNKATIFDLEKCRVLLLDQRGTGKSTPLVADETSPSSLSDNTTVQLIDDIDLVKAQLGIEGPWLVAGNSFGAMLAMSYSTRYPDAVSGLLLWSTFLGRATDIADVFHPGGRAAASRPTAYQEFLNHLELGERNEPTQAYGRLFWSPNPTIREEAALSWARWNRQLYYNTPRTEPERTREEVVKAMNYARLVQYYFERHVFLPNLFGASKGNNQLLEQVALIPDVPIRIVHGELDLATPLDGARSLADALSDAERRHESELCIVARSSHSSSEPGFFPALQAAARSLLDELHITDHK